MMISYCLHRCSGHVDDVGVEYLTVDLEHGICVQGVTWREGGR